MSKPTILTLLIILCLCPVINLASESKNSEVERFIEHNTVVIRSLKVGMTQAEVLASLGTASIDYSKTTVNNPWLKENYPTMDGRTVEVFYYLTRKRAKFTSLRKALTTPLIFEEGILIGWGFDFLKQLQSKNPEN